MPQSSLLQKTGSVGDGKLEQEIIFLKCPTDGDSQYRNSIMKRIYFGCCTLFIDQLEDLLAIKKAGLSALR